MTDAKSGQPSKLVPIMVLECHSHKLVATHDLSRDLTGHKVALLRYAKSGKHITAGITTCARIGLLPEKWAGKSRKAEKFAAALQAHTSDEVPVVRGKDAIQKALDATGDKGVSPVRILQEILG